MVDDQITVIGDDNTNEGSEPSDGGDGDGGDGDGDLEVLPGEGLVPGHRART